MKTKKWQRGALTLLLATLLWGTTSVVLADATTDTTAASSSVINERWGKPTFVYGGGLSASELAQTKSLLHIDDAAVKTENVTGSDLTHYLGSGSGDTSVMLSSVLVTREAAGHGITIKIDTPHNITQITAEEYKNPLITAGIKDATIEVASVKPVTGESALTGIYKAFDSNGETVAPDRAALGQEELEITNGIAQDAVQQQQNQNGQQSSREQTQAAKKIKLQLANTITEIKQNLAKNKNASNSQVTTIVNNAIANNKLTNVISQTNVNKLISLAKKYQTTAGVLNGSALSQLDQAKSSIGSALNKAGGYLKNAQNASWWQRLVNWVRTTWQSIFG